MSESNDVTISAAEYELLVRRDDLLTYLEYLGVGNWPIYTEAIDMAVDD